MILVLAVERINETQLIHLREKPKCSNKPRRNLQQTEIVHTNLTDKILATTMAGLEVKELCIGITLSKKSDTRPLPDDGPLQRGEAQGAQLSFST